MKNLRQTLSEFLDKEFITKYRLFIDNLNKIFAQKNALFQQISDILQDDTAILKNESIIQLDTNLRSFNFDDITKALIDKLQVIKNLQPEVIQLPKQQKIVQVKQQAKEIVQQTQGKLQGKKQQKKKLKKAVDAQKQKKVVDPPSTKLNLDYLNKDEFKINIVQEQIIKREKLGISHISLNNKKIGAQISKIFKNIKLKNLTYISIENNQITDTELTILSQIKFRKLIYLYCANNMITNLNILQKVKWKSLKYLSLSNNKLTSKSIVNLGLIFPQLKYLNLKQNKIGDEGLFNLFQCTLENLEYLHLQNCGITHECFVISNYDKTFKKRFSKLVHLHLNNNQIGEKGFEHIIKSQFFLQLKLISLQNIKINDNCLKFFDHINQEKEILLDTLDLSSNQLTDSGIQNLAKIDFKNMVRLVLKNNNLTTSSLRLLGKMQMPQFKILQIQNNKDPFVEEYVKPYAYQFKQKKYEKIFINV